jgi:hypothetical protein
MEVNVGRVKKAAPSQSSCCAPLVAGELGQADAAALARAFQAGAGLVNRERRGTRIRCRLVPVKLAELRAVLAGPARTTRKAATAR